MPQNSLNSFFHGHIPPVREFNREMDQQPLPIRQQQIYPIYRLAFSGWESLSEKNRTFIRRVVEHDRQLWLDFLYYATIMGRLRYRLQYPEAFLRMVKIVEYANRTRKISLNHLAMGILTAFEYNYRLSTAGDYIRQMVISAEQGMQFLGLIEIDEWG